MNASEQATICCVTATGNVFFPARFVHGPFAIIEVPGGSFRVIHTPTGLGTCRGSRCKTRGEAESLIKRLRRIRIDWWRSDGAALSADVATVQGETP